jgi:DNA-directed RNA polymerase specialized sigma24 family protein
MAPKQEKVRDKYWDEKHPKNDLDFVEISLAPDTFDLFLKTYAPKYYCELTTSTEDQQKVKKRKERLLRKIFKSASLTLTDRQFQIFILRHIFGLKEMEMARQLDVDQSYIANVLKASHFKIKKILRLNR